MTVVEQRRTLYRERVLDAAEAEFARVGFAETKMAAIARAAEVSLTTLYNVFPGKAEIWNDLHARRMASLLALVDERTAGTTSPLDRLITGVAAVAEFLVDHDAYLRLSLGTGATWLTVAGSTGVERSVWTSGLEMIGAGVEASYAAGEITTLRPRIAAGMVVSALQVWLADWIAADRDRPAAEVVDDLTDRLRVLLTTPRVG